MKYAGNYWKKLFDQVVDEWVGLSLPRPSVALHGLVQSDGCTWCGRSIEPQTICYCAKRHLVWSRVFRLGVYEPPLSECILQGKYAAWPEILELIGTKLGERVKGCVPPNSIIVPVPMPRLRRWFRRIDHAEVIARGVAKASGLRVKSVLRRHDSAPQAGKTASARQSMKHNTMWVRHLARVRGKSVILVDDVLTTGRTVEVASKALREVGATSVIIAVAAVAELPRKTKKCDMPL